MFSVAGMARRILIAVDESQHGGAAFDWYLNYMKKEGDEVHLLHVHNHHDLPTPARFSSDTAYMQAAQVGDVDSLARKRSMMFRYIDRLKEVQVSSKGHLAKNATHVGHEICRKADEVQPLCIIMGSRGVNLLRRTFLGSTSDYVLHHSPYPVAIVKHGELPPDDPVKSTLEEAKEAWENGAEESFENL